MPVANYIKETQNTSEWPKYLEIIVAHHIHFVVICRSQNSAQILHYEICHI
jgi:hypothetical protein